MMTLFDHGAARSTDPASSHEAAASAPVKGQRATILGLLRNMEQAWGTGTVTADVLVAKYPPRWDDEAGAFVGVQRNAWSSRLSGLASDGLVKSEGYRVNEYASGRRQRVRAYSLTDAGRVEAGRLLHPSAVTA